MNRNFFLLLLIYTSGCASAIPAVKRDKYKLPEKDFFVEMPTGPLEKAPYEVLGWVRTRADYSTMTVDEPVADATVCRNFYNKAANQIVHEAKKAGADAVIKVRSVVFLLDGKVEEHATAECTDDGQHGEIMLKGIAIRFIKAPKKPQ